MLKPSEVTFDACFQAMSYRFRVQSNLPSAEIALSRLLGPFRQTTETPNGEPTYVLVDRGTGHERRYELYLDGVRIHRVVSAGSMLDWLIADSCRSAVKSADGYIAVHAGVVARNEVAVILPAAANAGKTTLTAGLTMAGFSFLSDEVAVIDPDSLLVHPFPRPVMMDPESMDVLDGLRDGLPPAYEQFRYTRYHVAPDDLRPGALGGVSRIGMIVVPSYRAGSTTELMALSPAEMLMHMAQCTFNLDRLGSRAFQALARTVESCRAYRLSIGNLRDAVGMVADLISAEAIA